MRRAAVCLSTAGAALALGFIVFKRRRNKYERTWHDKGLAVKKSNIADAGDGLFATKPFKKGQCIAEYRGRRLTLAQALNLPNTDYLCGFGINLHIDSRFTMDSPARYVNDNFDEACLNAVFDRDQSKQYPTLIASRDIHLGEEIYAAYGESYWKTRGIDLVAQRASVGFCSDFLTSHPSNFLCVVRRRLGL